MNKLFVIVRLGSDFTLPESLKGDADATAKYSLCESESVFPVCDIADLPDAESLIDAIRDEKLSFLPRFSTTGCCAHAVSLKNADIIASSRISAVIKYSKESSGAYFVRCRSGSLLLCCDCVKINSPEELDFHIEKARTADFPYGAVFEPDCEEALLRLAEKDVHIVSTQSFFDMLCRMRADFPERELSFEGASSFSPCAADVYLSCPDVKASRVKKCADGSGDTVLRVFCDGDKAENHCVVRMGERAFRFTIGRNSFKTFRITDTGVRDTDTLEGCAAFDTMLDWDV